MTWKLIYVHKCDTVPECIIVVERRVWRTYKQNCIYEEYKKKKIEKKEKSCVCICVLYLNHRNIYIVEIVLPIFLNFLIFSHSLKDNNVAEICLKSKRNVAWFIIVNIWYIASVIIVKQYFFFIIFVMVFILFLRVVILLLIYFKINFSVVILYYYSMCLFIHKYFRNLLSLFYRRCKERSNRWTNVLLFSTFLWC